MAALIAIMIWFMIFLAAHLADRKITRGQVF